MLRADETLLQRVIQKFQQAPVKTARIQQPERLLIPAELAPRQHLEKFLERPVAARQRDEAVRQLRHQRLALVHRFHHAQIRQLLVDDFLDDELFGNHADDVAAVFQGRVGQDAHQAGHAAAIDQFNFFAGEQRAEFLRRRRVFRARAFVRAAIDCDAFHVWSELRTA